jgi:F420-dependent methylenetetrahydromethanopterin dehydrogenase
MICQSLSNAFFLRFRTVQSLTTCVAEYTQRCVEQDIEDLHNIVKGSVKLLEVCDKPNMYANAKVLMSCNKALNATDSTYQGCIYKSNKSIKSLQERYIARDPSIALQMMRTGTVLRDFCW